jgi:MFS family permease
MDADIFVPFVFFGFLAAIILVPIYLRERTRQSAHHLIAQALEKGQQLDPALMRSLTEGQKKPQDKARSSLGSGVVLLALAGGFIAAGYVIDGFDPSGMAQNGMMVPAVILGALGIAFILLAIVDYATKRKED